MEPALVTILLPVHNGGAYLAEAVASLERQTLRSFAVIAIDDGSTDGSCEWLERAAARQPWLRLIRQSQLGVARALNRGWVESRSEFVARMDADDLAVPSRLERQVRFLRAHPAVGVCGSWVRTFGAVHTTWRYPTDNDGIRARMFFDTPFAHPAVMFRRSAIADNGPLYRPEFRRAQDYDLWERLRDRCVFANVPEILLRYRVHASQATVADRRAMLTAAAAVRSRMFASWWPEVPAGDREWHDALCMQEVPVTPDAFSRAEGWLVRLRAHHRIRPFVPIEVWDRTLAVKWYEIARLFASLGKPVRMGLVRSPFTRIRAVSLARWLRLLALTYVPARRSRVV